MAPRSAATAAPAWQALHRALEAQEDSPDEMIRREHHREATDQLGIGNVISSMRLLSSTDWPLFFERVSLVEQVLRDDPAGAYGRMDFPTRDRYRHSVEELAKNARRPELDVARRAVTLAEEAMQHRADARPPSSRGLLPDLARTLHPRAAASAIGRRCGIG